MAGAVVTGSGLIKRLNATLNVPIFVRLFRNDVPILPDSVLGDFEPAVFPGYVDMPLTGTWSAAALDPVGRAFSVSPNNTWTRSAGGVVETDYGWIVYEDPDPDSVLIGGRRFTVPQVITTPGQVIMVSVIVFLLRG